LHENGTKVGDAERQALEDAVRQLRDVLTGEDAERIQRQAETLSQALSRFGEAVHRGGTAQEATGSGAAGGTSATGNDNVVDAEFEEVNDRKRGQG
jgi:molecular chaperone DnaK